MLQSPDHYGIGYLCRHRYRKYSSLLDSDKATSGVHWEERRLHPIEHCRLDEVIRAEWNIDDLFTIAIYKAEYHRHRIVSILDPAVEHWSYEVATSFGRRQGVVA